MYASCAHCPTLSFYIPTSIIKKVINMKRETINKVANFILTVITAFVSTFLMQSCMKF